MAVSLVRKRDVVANIDIAEDIRAFKYASFNNGVVKNFLQQCEYIVSTHSNIFFIQSGEIFIDAAQLVVDANGKEIEVLDISGVNYYSVFAEIDLTDYNNPTGDIKATYSSITYPTIDKGDDLTLVGNGVARLELYRFEANAGQITNVQKMFDLVEKEFKYKDNKLFYKPNQNNFLSKEYIIPLRKKFDMSNKTYFENGKVRIGISVKDELFKDDIIELSWNPTQDWTLNIPSVLQGAFRADTIIKKYKLTFRDNNESASIHDTIPFVSVYGMLYVEIRLSYGRDKETNRIYAIEMIAILYGQTQEDNTPRMLESSLLLENIEISKIID